MSKLSRKAILAVLSLVLTFVALGATTFAWFSLGTTATVNDFEVEVRGGEGLEVQLVGQNDWYSVINADVMNTFLNDGTVGVFKDGKMDAVTFADNKFQKFSKVNTDGTVDLVDAVANEDYLEFELKFRTEQADPKLDVTGFSFSSEAISWQPDLAFTNENGAEVTATSAAFDVYPHFAARLQIEGTEKHTFQEGNTSGNIGLDLEKGAHHYVAKKWGLDTLDAEDANANASIDVTTAKNIVSWTTETIGGVSYSVATVTVRVWLEGWDGNAYDAIFDGKFKVGFSFELQ